MAKFTSELPLELINAFENLDYGTERMMKEMCRRGAEVVYQIVLHNLKKSFKTTNSLEQGLKITKAFRTMKDDAINVKIAFYGYNNKGSVYIITHYKRSTHGSWRHGVPIPLIAIAREYGTSSGEAKKPFFRKAFTAHKSEIEQAMHEVEEKYLPKE